MSSQFNLDQEAFQNLLANAYVVQQSGVDRRSLRSVVELESAIKSGRTDLTQSMNLTAEGARRVADAAGVAIALVSGDQLVYRAGSGSAASQVGHQLTAILGVPDRNARKAEILRVENAQTDTRIEAAVCRQFGAESLLIVPIYCNRVLAGVMKVFFSEAHSFSEQEVQTYHLMAGLVGEAVACRQDQVSHALELSGAQPGIEKHLWVPRENSSLDVRQAAASYVTAPIVQTTVVGLQAQFPKIRQFASEFKVKSFGLARSAFQIATDRIQSLKVEGVVGAKGIALAAATAIVLLSLFAYLGIRSRASQGTASISSQVSVPVIDPSPSTVTVKPAVINTTKDLAEKPQWVRVGTREMDYVYSDVTVRYFEPAPRLNRSQASKNKVHYISDDVTVRYFDRGEESLRKPTEVVHRREPAIK